MAYTLRLRQSSTTLVDFQDATKYQLTQFGTSGMGAPFGAATVRLHFNGTSADVLFDNIITLNRALNDAAENLRLWQAGQTRTPIYLQFQHANGTNLVQAECFGLSEESAGALESILAVPDMLLANRILDVTLTLKITGYFEETAAVQIASTTLSNNGALLTLTNMRGDLPAPLIIKTRTATTSQDRTMAALLGTGTPANWTTRIEAEAYTTRGSNVADRTNANFSTASGAPQGQRWTPGSTTEQELITLHISSNVADNLKPFRLFLRCLENGTAGNTKVRARLGLVVGSTYQWGDYAQARRGVNTNSGTTAVSLIDCGLLIPPDVSNLVPSAIAIQIAGKATTTGAGNEFDMDCVYRLPAYDGALGTGLQIATYGSSSLSVALGSSTTPDGMQDGWLENAYLWDGTNIQYRASNVQGNWIYGTPNRTQRLIVLTQQSTNERHTQNLTNTITVTYYPRYRLGRGS